LGFILACLFISIGTAEENQESGNLVQREMIALDMLSRLQSMPYPERTGKDRPLDEVNKIRGQVEHAVEHKEKISLPKTRSASKSLSGG